MGGKPRARAPELPMRALARGRGRAVLGGWTVTFPGPRATDDLSVDDLLGLAEDFHKQAERHLRMAVELAEESGKAIELAPPPKSFAITPPAELCSEVTLGLDWEIDHARRRLGIPPDATTAEIKQAVAERDERGAHVSDARTAARLAHHAALAAESASAVLPGLRVVAWLCSHAASRAGEIVGMSEGSFTYGKHSPNVLADVVTRVQVVGKVGLTDAVRLILRTQEHGDRSLDSLVAKLVDRVKKARKKKAPR